jgi:ATP-dependent Clp protease protease subunit
MATDIQITADNIIKTRAMLNGLYAHHTGQPLEKIEKIMDRDFWMTADEAKEFGLIDEVISSRPATESNDK